MKSKKGWKIRLRKVNVARRSVSLILSIALMLSLCSSTALANDDGEMTADEYILAFEEALTERDRAAILGDEEKEAAMNQILEAMGAEELTGQEVADLLSENEGASPRLGLPTEGKFKWTTTRVTTHYNGQYCEVMMVYISPIAEIDSKLINQGLIAEGDELEYYTDSTVATDLLNILSFAINTFDTITSLISGETFKEVAKDAAITVAEYAVESLIDSIPDAAPAGTTFTYQIVNYTYLKWALVKPLTTSDDDQVIQLMASKTETHISFDMQMRYTNEQGKPDVLNLDDDFIVVHSGDYYAYSISEVAKDYCLGAEMKTSYVGYLPIYVGGKDHEKLLISIDTFAPATYVDVFYYNEL